MRQVKAQTSSGDIFLNYVISTPQSDDAEKIDPSLPTILFLHPMYVGKVIFHSMSFSCRTLGYVGGPANEHTMGLLQISLGTLV